MNASNFLKAGVLTLVLTITFLISWEYSLRSKGVTVAYDDGNELWADKREKIYKPADKATVLIGSSRNKFDLDIETWRTITGEDAVQLAFEGASPLPILEDLANDPKFKGKLLIDVTEGLFFGLSGGPRGYRVSSALDYYKKITPAQKFSFKVNHILESNFVFLDRDWFSLNSLLDKIKHINTEILKKNEEVEKEIKVDTIVNNFENSFLESIFNDPRIQPKFIQNFG